VTTVSAAPSLQLDLSKLLFFSILCALGTWTYANRVLIPHQISDSAAHGRPRGNLSDLYPRWVGAEELLLHGRDPYSADVTRRIQTGYYGRPLDPSRPSDPVDQQAFAYPAYVVFYLAPTVRFSFPVVQRVFFWILVAVTLASIPLWLRVLNWPASPAIQAAIMALTIGSLSVLQALKLQQLTLLVAAMCALAIALLVSGRPIAAGILLALAAIKPQLLLPLLLWFAFWTFGDLKRRYLWAISFSIAIALLCSAAEFLLAHWIARFWHALGEYWQYARAIPMLEAIFPRLWGRSLEICFITATAILCWKRRKQPANTGAFQSTTSLVLALTVLMVPTFSLYNQVLLLPAVLLLARDRATFWRSTILSRILLVIAAALLAWPWLTSALLASLSFVLPQQTLDPAWSLPLYALPQIPIAVAALMLLHSYRLNPHRTFTAPAGPGSS
jgi:Glycosyltransferase family 87